MIVTKSASQAVLGKGAQQCEKFVEIYPVLFPKESITRKMHVLICILPIYIRHGSVYKFMKIEQNLKICTVFLMDWREDLKVFVQNNTDIFQCYKNMKIE